MDKEDVYSYIISEEATYKTLRVPVTTSKDWNMHEHIERCTNVANAWFHGGKNDGNRPYSDIVTPIINVAFRSEGFDVKDIIPFVNDADEYHKSFLVKKYHPQWARKNELDTFIDEMVESSVIYDLVLVKNCNNVRPEVVPLQSIAFCDQTDILAGAICLKHEYSLDQMANFSGKWYADKVDEAITMSRSEKTVAQAGDQKVQTPGRYVEVYELHGMFPETWLDPEGDPNKFSPQLHIVTFYKSDDGKKHGICLFKGIEKTSIFKALVIKKVFGRAMGRSIVESLFEEQVWTNYDGIRIKELLDAAAIVLFHTDDDELGNQKLSKLKNNTILKLKEGKTLTRTDTTAPNITSFINDKESRKANARTLGSASEAALGINPTSGTPFKLQDLITTEGQGIHEYRQGKIATFTSDQLYRDWILDYLVDDMDSGKKFSEELSLDELSEIAETITKNEIEKKIKRMILASGKVPTNQERDAMRKTFKDDFMKKGFRRFFEVLQGELKDIPKDVYVNVAGKQRKMAQNADRITNIIREVLRNPVGFATVPGIGKAVNQLLEESGMNPIDYSQITNPPVPEPIKSPIAPEVASAKKPEPIV